MSDYVLVRDICRHEDYPCCGCSTDAYPMESERAKEYQSEGRIEILGDYDPISGTLRHDVSQSDYSDEVAKFAQFERDNPNLDTSNKRDYSKLEDFILDLISGMEYDEVMALGDELGKSDEVSLYLDDFYELVWDMDWSNDDIY